MLELIAKNKPTKITKETNKKTSVIRKYLQQRVNISNIQRKPLQKHITKMRTLRGIHEGNTNRQNTK